MRNGKYSKSTGYKSMALLLAMVLLVGCAIGGTLAWLVDSTQEVKNTFTTSNIDIELTETGTTKDDTTGNETRNYKMVPGWTLSKDPKVTVKAGSEDCYLFIMVDEEGSATLNGKTLGIEDYLAYTLWYTTDENKTNWTAGKGTGEGGDGIPTNVYYTKITGMQDAKENKEIKLLLKGEMTFEGVKYTWNDDEVLTRPDVTKEMMDAMEATTATKPSITFTAYASQLWKTNKPTGEGVTDEQIAAAQFTPYQAWLNVNPSTT